MATRLYVGNLPLKMDTASLLALFGGTQAVRRVWIALDKATGRKRGFGYVEMATAEEADRAILRLDGAAIDGHALRVIPAVV